ncbi:hypothetical protein HUU53_01215 [Candidatus Micrarchaeota archaeon]|nr:hypothetical protein [Candidatus Micrarchaeota archaeon]
MHASRTTYERAASNFSLLNGFFKRAFERKSNNLLSTYFDYVEKIRRPSVVITYKYKPDSYRLPDNRDAVLRWNGDRMQLTQQWNALKAQGVEKARLEKFKQLVEAKVRERLSQTMRIRNKEARRRIELQISRDASDLIYRAYKHAANEKGFDNNYALELELYAPRKN